MLTLEEIRQFSPEELKKETANLEQELLKMKLLTHAGQSKETNQLKQLRRTIARMKTCQSATTKSAN